MSHVARLIPGTLRLYDERVSCVDPEVAQYQDDLVVFTLIIRKLGEFFLSRF